VATTTQEIIAAQQKANLAKSAIDLKSIHNALVVENKLVQLPEQVFINELLPFLCGETLSQVTPAIWVSVAGTPFLEIEIIDTKGQVLFKVPALMERNAIVPDGKDFDGSFHNVLLTAEQLKHQSPFRAKAFLEHAFKDRSIAKNVDELARKNLKRREEILARYNMDINGKPIGKNTKSTDFVVNNTQNLNLVYDDDLL
jgi:hypothetical protein